MAKRQYKVAVTGELADRLMEAMPETEWMNEHRISSIVFVVEADGLASDKGSSRYPLDIMTLGDGTFPELDATDVTGKPWAVFP